MNDYNEEDYEPMDIDQSAQSAKEMDISYGDSAEDDSKRSRIEDAYISTENKITEVTSVPNISSIKTYHIVKKKPLNSANNLRFKVISAVIVIFLSVVTYHISNIQCSDDLNVKLLTEVLSSSVFGQSQALRTIIETLESTARSKILFFYGGTGVGKTFVASLLLSVVGLHSNVYHYTMPSFTTAFSTDGLLGLTFCPTSLFIVDDLTGHDMHIVKQINDIVSKSDQLQRNITVILIFNCQTATNDLYKICDEKFEDKLFQKFDEIDAIKRFVKFEPLSEVHLRKCIEKELGCKELNKDKIDSFISHFNVTVDGCKGVHAKMKYLSII